MCSRCLFSSSIIYFSELSFPDCMPDISVTRLSLKSSVADFLDSYALYFQNKLRFVSIRKYKGYWLIRILTFI
jgi:hypothetical protein